MACRTKDGRLSLIPGQCVSACNQQASELQTYSLPPRNPEWQSTRVFGDPMSDAQSDSDPYMPPCTADCAAARRVRIWKVRGLVLAVVVSAAGTAYFLFRETLTLENLAANEQQLKQFCKDSPVSVYTTAFLVYVTVTGLSLPGAAVLTVAYAWFFDFVPAVILVSFASTTGATVAFLLSRYLLGTSFQERFADRLRKFDSALGKDGAFYLFTLRLIPAVPFFVINVVMGLTKLPLRTFWWVSQVGMLPGTAAYVYAGSNVPNLQTLNEQGVGGLVHPGLLIAFAVLGIFALALKKVVGRFRHSTSGLTADNNTE